MKELTISEVEQVAGGVDLISTLWKKAIVKFSVVGLWYETITDLGEGFAQGMESAHEDAQGSCKIGDPIKWP